MDTKTQRMGRKGVSPVIATILLIAVTVIMVGVLAGFVFTQTGELKSKPMVSLVVKDQPNTDAHLVLKHVGGDAVDWADLRISVTENADSATMFVNPTDNPTDNQSDNQWVLSPQAKDDDFVAGKSVIISGTSASDNEWVKLIEDHYYHVVVTHEPSDSVLLDVNVRVTSA